MPIQTRDELIRLLSEVWGLSERDRNVMVDTAHFAPEGLSGLYMRPMLQTCTNVEIDGFFRRARSFMDPYGSRNDGQVYYHRRPNGLPPPAGPCEDQQWWSCWVPNNPSRKKGRS
jgi:hypothetical protein